MRPRFACVVTEKSNRISMCRMEDRKKQTTALNERDLKISKSEGMPILRTEMFGPHVPLQETLHDAQAQ